MTQLYAKIKRSSEHHSQNSYHMKSGKFIPFKVEYNDESSRFIGGVGGNYKTDDLNIYVKHGKEFKRVGA